MPRLKVAMKAGGLTSKLEEPNVLHEALHAARDIVVGQEVQHTERPGGCKAALLVCLESFLD